MARETMKPPPPAPIDIEQKYKTAKAKLEESFAAFHKVLSDKVLEDNKSQSMKNHEHFIITELTKAAVALDQLNVGEGVTAMAVIAIREHLKVRDRVNELEYELELLKRELKQSKAKNEE